MNEEYREFREFMYWRIPKLIRLPELSISCAN